jgi:hypothetical protein
MGKDRFLKTLLFLLQLLGRCCSASAAALACSAGTVPGLSQTMNSMFDVEWIDAGMSGRRD